MKNLKYLLLGFGLLLTGCSDDVTPDIPVGAEPVKLDVYADSPFVTIAEDGGVDIDFRAVGGTVTFNVDSSLREWSLAKEDAGWLTTEEGYDTFSVTAPYNENNSVKEATLKVVSGEGEAAVTVTINVKQRALGGTGIELSAYEVNLAAIGDRPETVVVTSTNDAWTFETNSQWLLVEENGDNIILTATTHTGYIPRQTIVKVVAKSGGQTGEEEIIVTQDPTARISVGRPALSFFTDGGSGSMEVSINVGELQVDAVYDWIDISVNPNENTLTYTISPNSGNLRNAEITLTGGKDDNTAEAVINVMQVGNEAGHFVVEMEIPENAVSAYSPIYGAMDCTIYWGDGTSEVFQGGNENPTHEYPSPGTYYQVVAGNFSHLYSGISVDVRNYLTEVKQWGNPQLVSMQNAFFSCTNLRRVPGDTQGAFAEVTTFESAFQACVKLDDLPSDLLAHGGNVTTINKMFYHSSTSSGAVLSGLPEGFLDACTKLTNIGSAFMCCTELKTLPANLLRNCPGITELSQAFYQSGLEEIPEGLFDSQTELTSLAQLFSYTKIKGIPEDLFRYNTKVTNVNSLFTNCSQLEAIPANLFRYNTEINSFYNVFNGCSSLTTIPAGLFATTTKNTEFRNCFANCTSLVSIPAGLFDNSPNVLNYFGVFQACSALKDIPAGLFANATSATTVERAFYNCKSLEIIPDNLFNCPNSTTGANIFYGCEKIKKIPDGLLDSFTKATTFASAFYGCTALEEVPVSLFDECKVVINFNQTFRNCTSWAGETPYTEISGTKYKLWQRAAAPGYSTVTNSTNCFNGCTALLDYADIITGWK